MSFHRRAGEGPANAWVLYTSTLLLPRGVWEESQVQESQQLESPPKSNAKRI